MTKDISIEYTTDQQLVANYARVLSHPARIAIIKLLAEKKEIRTGNISDFLPLSRTTVSQHLKELKEIGIINGTIDGLKIHYCLNPIKLNEIRILFNQLFDQSISNFICNCD
ncbi:MAG: ArsR/SmtB family transcription factor [Bacteroidales bacterium]